MPGGIGDFREVMLAIGVTDMASGPLDDIAQEILDIGSAVNKIDGKNFGVLATQAKAASKALILTSSDLEAINAETDRLNVVLPRATDTIQLGANSIKMFGEDLTHTNIAIARSDEMLQRYSNTFDGFIQLELGAGSAGDSFAGVMANASGQLNLFSIDVASAFDRANATVSADTDNMVNKVQRLRNVIHTAGAAIGNYFLNMDHVGSGGGALGFGKGNRGGGFGRWGAGAVGALLVANQILPLTTIAAAAVVAAGSLIAVVGALAGVAAGAILVGAQWSDLLPKTSAFTIGIMSLRQQLFQTAKTLLNSGGVTGAFNSLTDSLHTLIGQATPMLSSFIQSMAGFGQSFATAFLSPGAGGMSIFQQWGIIINNFVHTAGAGLLHLFVALQPAAQAIVIGIGKVITAFGHAAIFSPGLIQLTTDTLNLFFKVLVQLVPIFEKFSTTMDSVGITMLQFISNMMPAISAAFTTFGIIEKVVAGVIAGIGAVLGWLMRLKVVGPVVQIIIGLAGAFLLLSYTLNRLKLVSVMPWLVTLGANMIRTGSVMQGLMSIPIVSTLAEWGGAFATAAVAVAPLALAVGGFAYLAHQNSLEIQSAAKAVLTYGVNSTQAAAAIKAAGGTPAGIYPGAPILRGGRAMVPTQNTAINQAIAQSTQQVSTAQEQAAKSAEDMIIAQLKAAQTSSNLTLAMTAYGNAIKNSLAAQTNLTGPGMASLKQFASATGQSFLGLATTAQTAVEKISTDGGAALTTFFAQTKSTIEQWKQTTATSFNFVATAMQTFSGKAKVSAQAVITSFNKALQQQKQYSNNWDTVVKRGAPQAVLQQIQGMAQGGAGFLQMLAGASKQQFNTIVGQMKHGAAGSKSLADTMAQTLGITLQAVIQLVQTLILALIAIPPKVTSTVTVDTTQAMSQLNALAALWATIPGGALGGYGHGHHGMPKPPPPPPSKPGGTRTPTSVTNVNVKTNATAKDIVKELTWAQRTRGY